MNSRQILNRLTELELRLQFCNSTDLGYRQKLMNDLELFEKTEWTKQEPIDKQILNNKTLDDYENCEED